jgi:hypothetical protein
LAIEAEAVAALPAAVTTATVGFGGVVIIGGVTVTIVEAGGIARIGGACTCAFCVGVGVQVSVGVRVGVSVEVPTVFWEEYRGVLHAPSREKQGKMSHYGDKKERA